MLCDLLSAGFQIRTDKILFCWKNYCGQMHIYEYCIIYNNIMYNILWTSSTRNSTVNWFFTQIKYITWIFYLFRTQFVQCSFTVVKEILAHWFLSNLLSALSTKRTIFDPETILW